MLTIVVCYFMTELYGAFMIPRAVSERASERASPERIAPKLVTRFQGWLTELFSL